MGPEGGPNRFVGPVSLVLVTTLLGLRLQADTRNLRGGGSVRDSRRPGGQSLPTAARQRA